jgi:hypothetical protein
VPVAAAKETRRYRRFVRLDPQQVPEPCRVLLPLAERWGLGDDYEREALVSTAGNSELEALVRSVDAVPDEALYGWLAGPESQSAQPTQEYVAVTCLTMAVASARLELSRRYK